MAIYDGKCHAHILPYLMWCRSAGLSSVGNWLNESHFIRGGADKSLARPASRCRWTESIVSLERGVCSCAALQVFSCY